MGGRFGSMEPVLSAPHGSRDERLPGAENLWSQREAAGRRAGLYRNIVPRKQVRPTFFPQGGPLRPGVRPQGETPYGGEALER